jgi:hypothetical protein
MNDGNFADWVRDFEECAARRSAAGDPPLARGARLDAALVASLQRFQVGEDGDGATLIAKAAAAGDSSYLAAVRLFVAEEQGHARLLRLLLASAGASTIAGHWSDSVFVAIRRRLGLRLELMTLMLAEVVALRYYRALRDGTGDPLLAEVAGRILADEERHVPFHCQRLRAGFAGLPAVARTAVAAGWWLLLIGTVTVVAVDHGRGLRRLGLGRLRFALDVAALFRTVVTEVLGRPLRLTAVPVAAPTSGHHRADAA